MDLKPDVCWQLPLRHEDDVADDGHVDLHHPSVGPAPLGRRSIEFHWWCTESPEAFVGTGTPVYLAGPRAELTAMVGERTYERLVAYLTDRARRVGESSGAATSSGAARGLQRLSLRRLTSDARGANADCVAEPANAPRRSIVERIRLRVVTRRRHGPQYPVVLVLFGKAPRCMNVLGLGAALRAPLTRHRH